MAKKALLTVDGVYRKVRKGLITDENSVYRKVKKAFITVGGVYRPSWWAGDTLAYYGTATPIGYTKARHASASTKRYAFFGGGTYYSALRAGVNVYNSLLTKKSLANLTNSRARFVATNIDDDAVVFAGGYKSGDSTAFADAYSTSLTKLSGISDLANPRYNHSAASVDGHALFAGGNITTTERSQSVEAYNKDLVLSAAPDLSEARQIMGATSIGGLAVFAGGSLAYGHTTAVDAYSKDLTRIEGAPISAARCNIASTTMKTPEGEFAIFAGGETTNYNFSLSAIDILDENLTLYATMDLSVARCCASAASLDGYAIITGGFVSTSECTDVTEVLDKTLTITTYPSISSARGQMAAASVGDYALFTGGTTNPEPSTSAPFTDVVDAFALV